MRIAEIYAFYRKSGSRNMMVTSGFRPEVEIQPFHACAMHPAIVTGTVRSLWNWLWGRYHVPQNVFLVECATSFMLYDVLHYTNMNIGFIHFEK